MKKILGWTKKPVTWGGYLKLCGISAIISMVITAGCYVYIFWDNISGFVSEKINKRKRTEE
ncbi:MAG: hypothetical protein PHS74_00540 [Lachnospiraceae bacterium]|nr:hypothetical protein [Lachnospiraceae bacterium]